MATLVVEAALGDLSALKTGALIGEKYKIVEELGRGGFGAVFRCTHIGTGQDVAVKILSLPGGQNDAVFKQFFLEARAAAGLGHPNTLRVFDFGQDTGGTVYLVMEVLAGRTLADELRDRLRRGEVFTELEALSIGDSVLRSLKEAHDKGLIHRDIRPQNIFLHQVHGDDPAVKVLDFGIAQSAELAARNAFLPEGQVLGTPAYLSPEQAQRLPIDRRADLYAVGVVLYELVAGTPPFAADRPEVTLQQHVADPPPPLRQRARVTLSDGFVAAVERALAKRPEDRFGDASAMRLALYGKRGRVSGSQLAVRVSSSQIPVVRVSELPIEAQLPEITVNGVTMDAASLQPRTTKKLTIPRPGVDNQFVHALPRHWPWRFWLTRLLILTALAAALAAALRIYQRRAEWEAREAAKPPLPPPSLPPPSLPKPVAPPPTPPVPVEASEPPAEVEPIIPPPPSFAPPPGKGKSRR